MFLFVQDASCYANSSPGQDQHQDFISLRSLYQSLDPNNVEDDALYNELEDDCLYEKVK